MKKYYMTVICMLTAMMILAGCGSNKESAAVIDDNFESQDSYDNENKNSITDDMDVPDTILIKNKSTTEYVNGNLVNEGMIAKQDEWLFYSLTDGIYKVKTDGTEEQKLCDTPGLGIVVLDDWVYFKYMGLYRVKTDGSNLEQLSDISKPGTFNIVDNKIHYCLEYKMDLDGSNCEQIYDKNAASAYTINIVDDWIYFFDTDLDGKEHIYKMKTDASDLQIIFDGKVDYMIVDGEWIYFQNYYENRALYKMKTDGSNVQLVLDVQIGALNVVDDWIFYTRKDGDIGLYKMKVDGSENQMLCPDRAYRLNIIDDYIYYRINSDRTNSLYKIKIDGSDRQVFYEGGID